MLEMTHRLIMNSILFGLLAGKLTKQTCDTTLYKTFQKHTKRDSLQYVSRYQREYLIIALLLLTRLVNSCWLWFCPKLIMGHMIYALLRGFTKNRILFFSESTHNLLMKHREHKNRTFKKPLDAQSINITININNYCSLKTPESVYSRNPEN